MKKNVLMKALSVLVSLTMILSPVSALAQESVAIAETDIEAEAVEEELAEEVSGVEEAADITLEEVLAGELVEATEEETVSAAAFSSVGGALETIYAEVSGVSVAQVTGVSWTGTASGSLTADDLKFLVRQDDDSDVRIDVPGVKAGTYTLTVNTAAGNITKENIKVLAHDRSGFAHYGDKKANAGGVGAYDNDGVLKSNALVVYVNDDNKNSVEVILNTATKTARVDYDASTTTEPGANEIVVKGIGNFLNSNGQACSDAGHETECKKVDEGKSYYAKANTNQGILKKFAEAGIPLDIRCVGIISDSGLYKAASFDASKESLIEGLTAYALKSAVKSNCNLADYGGTGGDNGHMARMKSVKDMTIEGIGTDATWDGWGVHLICEGAAPALAKSFEVRNLTFINTPEDAIGMEGQQTDGIKTLTASVERCWVHNNEFYCPVIANPAESDKAQGDGSCDFKRGQYFTCSYNYFEGCHKTNLVGSSDSSYQFNLTYHHNYWRMCEARGPLTRQANVHMYNNLYWGQISYAMNTRADAYIFSEYNNFFMCKEPMAVDSGAIKSFNDSFGSLNDGVIKQPGTFVNDKSEKVANNCGYKTTDPSKSSIGPAVDYSSFDTDPTLSYIPSGDYDLQDDVTEARKVIAKFTGVMKESIPSDDGLLSSNGVSNFKEIGLFSGDKDKFVQIGKVDVTAFPFENAPGKLEKGIYVFSLPTKCDVTVKYASDEVKSTGVIVNEAGVAMLTASGTAYSLPAGNYAIQPFASGAGKYAGKTLPSFKSCTVESLKVELADSSYDPTKLTDITISDTSKSLLVGDNYNLSVKFVPISAKTADALVWTSSDSSVAEVSASGVVTAKKLGTTIISASVGGFTKTCTINVTEPIHITNAILDTSEISLMEGKSAKINVVAAPANNTDKLSVVYSSSDKRKATVDSTGIVVAVGEGTATITAKIYVNAVLDDNDTPTGDPQFTETCAVTITPAPKLPHDNNWSINYTQKTKNDYKSSGIYNIGSASFTTGKNYSYKYAGQTYTLTNCLTIKSGAITFTAPKNGTFLGVVISDSNDATVSFGDSSNAENITLTKGVVTEVKKTVEAGKSYALKQVNKDIRVLYLSFSEGEGASSESVPVTGVSLSKSSAQVAVGGTETLIATINPENATNKVVNWSSDNPFVAKVSGGVVTGIADGEATITVSSAEDPSICAECVVTVGEGGQEPDGGKESSSSSSEESDKKDENGSSSTTGDNGKKSSSSSSEAAVVNPDTNNPETVKPEKEKVTVTDETGKEIAAVDYENNRTYNGKKQIFDKDDIVITVVDDNGQKVELIYGKDFKVSYKNNKDANMMKDEKGNWANIHGDAADAKDEDKSLKNPYAIIKYKGAYKSLGMQKIFFDIYPVNMANVSLTEKKATITAKNAKKVKFLKCATVSFFGKTKKLNLNKDILEYKMVCTKCEEDPTAVGKKYDLNESIDAPAGTYRIYASGQGNFYGETVESEFELVRK